MHIEERRESLFKPRSPARQSKQREGGDGTNESSILSEVELPVQQLKREAREFRERYLRQCEETHSLRSLLDEERKQRQQLEEKLSATQERLAQKEEEAREVFALRAEYRALLENYERCEHELKQQREQLHRLELERSTPSFLSSHKDLSSTLTSDPRQPARKAGPPKASKKKRSSSKTAALLPKRGLSRTQLL